MKFSLNFFFPKLILLTFLFLSFIFLTGSVSANGFGIDNPYLPSIEEDIDCIEQGGDNLFGDYFFNGGWESGGLSIIGGDIYAQVGHFNNITYLNITHQNLTVTDNLIVGGNVTANYYFGDGSELTGVIGANASWNESSANEHYLNLSGTNANQNIDISPYNLTVGKISMDDDLNLGSNRIYNVGEIVMDPGSWIRGFATAAVVFADHIQARNDKIYDIGNVTDRFRNLYLYGNISTKGNVSASYFFGDGAYLTNLEVSGNFSGRGIPHWLNNSNALYINSSYPQNINISGNATFGGGAIFKGATIENTLGYENIRFGVYSHTPRIIFDNGSQTGQMDFVGGHLRFIINDSVTGWTNRATMRINSSSVRIGEAGRRRDLYLYGDLIGVDPAGGGANINMDGDIDITGNFTGNQIYGEMWYHNHTATELNFASSGVFYNLTFSESKTNGFTFNDADDNLEALVDGRYLVNYMASSDGQNNHLYYTSVFVNGVSQESSESHKKMTAGGDIVTMTGSGFIDLEVGDTVHLATADVGSTGTGNYYSSNLNLVRIGD